MKRILTILLALVMTICLVNLNNSYTKAEENANPQLYFEKGDNGYSFYTKNGATTTEYTTGKGTTWSVRGDDNHPILELHGFSYTSDNDQTRVLSLYPHTPNVELTIEVYGENSFISSASGDHLGYVWQFSKSTYASFSKVEIVGMTSDAKLNLKHTGATTKRQNTIATVLGITADGGALNDLTFKDITFNIDLNDPAELQYSNPPAFGNAMGISVGIINKLTIDNSIVSINAGKTEVSLPVVPGTTVVKPCFSITNDAAKDDSISLIGNSKLILSGTLCATYATDLSKLLSSPQISYKAYTSMDGKPGSEASDIKYETFTLITGFDIPTYTNGKDAPNKLPIKRLEITSGESKPVDPSPSKKDESCEKVIGPTWHWNESKGICEDVGVVGTATR